MCLDGGKQIVLWQWINKFKVSSRMNLFLIQSHLIDGYKTSSDLESVE